MWIERIHSRGFSQKYPECIGVFVLNGFNFYKFGSMGILATNLIEFVAGKNEL